MCIRDSLKSTWVNPRTLSQPEAERVLGKAIEREYPLFELLRRPGVGYEALLSLEGGRWQPVAGVESDDLRPVVSRETLGDGYAAVVEQIEIAAQYAGYIERQRDEVERGAAYENLRLPADMDYHQVAALSIEVRQKLAAQRPETLGQAARISGVTPAAISLLLIHLKRSRGREFALPEPAP